LAWMFASLANRSIVFLPGRATCQQFIACDGRALGVDLRPQGLCFLFSSLQISPHFVTMPKVIGDDRVDVSQYEGVVSSNDIFRSHAVVVLLVVQHLARATQLSDNQLALRHEQKLQRSPSLVLFARACLTRAPQLLRITAISALACIPPPWTA